MTDKKLAFDTLEYATLLKEKGVANPEAHAASLATVIIQNLYTKSEVDKMIDAALQRFDERTRIMEKELREELHSLDKKIEITGSRTIYMTVGILGSLIALVGAAATFTHYFVH